MAFINLGIKKSKKGKKKRSITKKGVIEVGFAWIFILIAGALILGLFTYIGVTQSSFFMDLFSAKLLKDLNTIFVGTEISRDTAATFEIPKTKLAFDCNSYSIGSVSFPLGDRFIFAPSEIESPEIVAWSKSWNLGFRVANFLYLTSPYTKYYVVYDSNVDDSEVFANDIMNDLPTILDKEMFDINVAGDKRIENRHYERIIVLMFGSFDVSGLDLGRYDPDDFREYDEDEITFIYVKSPAYQGGVKDSNFVADLIFRNKNQLIIAGPMEIIDKSALYAAFISGNPDIFECKYERAFTKAQFVTRLYSERAKKLKGPGCDNSYEIEAPGVYTKMMNDLGAVPVSRDDIIEDVIRLDALNNFLEQKSCPLMY